MLRNSVPPRHVSGHHGEVTSEPTDQRQPAGDPRVASLRQQVLIESPGPDAANPSPIFADAVQTLYPVAYALKFAGKRELGRDYVVPPLEGLWWADDMDAPERQRTILRQPVTPRRGPP